MKLQTITSNLWFKLKNRQPIDCTVTMEGTGSATAYIYDNKLVVELAAAQTGKYVNISTPIGFRVLNAYSIHNNASSSTWQIANTTDAITAAVTMAASDTDIDVAASIDDGYNTFASGDDDLRLIIGTAAATATIVIEIEPTMA